MTHYTKWRLLYFNLLYKPRDKRSNSQAHQISVNTSHTPYTNKPTLPCTIQATRSNFHSPNSK